MINAPRFLLKSAAFCALLLPWVIYAQPLPPSGFAELTKERTANSPLFNKILRGETPFDAKNEEHNKAVDSFARFFAYRVTQEEIQKEPGKMDAAFKEVESLLRQLRSMPVVPAPTVAGMPTSIPNPVATNFISRLHIRCREVYPNLKTIARVNAVRMQSLLPTELATCDQMGKKTLPGQFMDSFLTVFEKAPDEGMKLYALKGMAATYQALRPLAVEKKAANRVFLDPALEAKIQETLCQFVESKPQYAENAPEEEKEGFRILRREAIRALAQTRLPMTGAKAKTAFVLARFANGKDIAPEQRFDEKVEAAIGLLNMRPVENDPNDFNLDCAIQHFGHFLVDYFQRYNSRNDQEADKIFPWRYQAARINDALNSLRAEVKSDYLNGMYPLIVVGLNSLETGKEGKVENLGGYLREKPLASQLLFKKIPGTEVKLDN
ncbi:MAG: hypothetical protein EXR99_10725 [Gemmataceae bacterium]|nr:hypothetical protein [Gemmataceae bacterium]